MLNLGCAWTSDKREHNINRMNRVIDLWNNLKGIQTMHGKASMIDGRGGGSHIEIDGILKARIDARHNFHPDFLLKDKVWDRLEAELKIYDKRIRKKGFVNPLENIAGVPHEIVKRSPLSWRAYGEVDKQVSYERTNLGHLNNFTKEASGHLLNAFENAVNRGELGPEGVRALANLQKLEKKILKSDSKADRAAYEIAIRRLLGLDKEQRPGNGETAEGVIIKMFKDGIEMDKAEWDKAKTQYDPALRDAVESSKKYFGKMGSVLVNGLEAMSKNYLLRRHGTTDKQDTIVKTNKQTQRFLEGIKDNISQIKKGIESGGYLPHYILKDLPMLKQAMDGMMAESNSAIFDANSKNATSILHNMAAAKSHRAKGRSDLDYSWHNDPIMIGQMYGYDVIGFNKQNHLQRIFTEFTRDMSKASTKDKYAAEFVEGMGRYMEDIYTMATKGYKDRPDWVNGMVSGLGKATVLRTMGLGLTGSVRNVASAATFYAHFGHKVIKNAVDVYDKQTAKGEIGEIVRQAEKENGFLFMEGNPDIANELITHGMLPKEGIDTKSIRFNPIEGKIEYKDKNGIRKWVEQKVDSTIESSLVFHRFTENFTRKWMFRVAFINHFQTQMGQPEYAKNVGARKIYNDSKNFAINAVNSWAYEYAGHAKSKMIRGVPGTLDKDGNLNNTGKVFMGAASQSMNMLMHYPHSLIATHIRILRNAGVSLKVGDFSSPEMQYLWKYAGIYSAIQLASVASNLDINNIAENDTIEKMKETHKSIVHFDDADKKTRGVLGQFFGPLADDIRYALEMTGLKSADRSDIEKILIGNIDYANQTGDDAAKSFWYKLGTFPGLIMTKVGPSLADGQGWDAIRHFFGMYPSQVTRDLNEEYVQPLLDPLFGDYSDVEIDKELKKTAKAASERGYGRRYANQRV